MAVAWAVAWTTVGFGGLAAQAETNQDEGMGGRGSFQIGYLRLDLDDLDSALDGAALPSIGEDFLTMGGAGFASRGRFLFGGEGHAVLGAGETTAGGGRQLNVSGGYGMFRVGYLVLTGDAFDVYPLFGLGGGAMSLKIAERFAPTFDQVIADPETSSVLSNAQFVLDVGLGASYRITMSGRENRFGGILLGVHAGYSFAPAQSAWSLDGTNDVAGGPDLRIQGPYVRLSVGGWARRNPELR
jgi:opacity protein-like surface antigen